MYVVGVRQICVCQCVVVFHFFGYHFPVSIRCCLAELCEHGDIFRHCQFFVCRHGVISVPDKSHFVATHGIIGSIFLRRQFPEPVGREHPHVLHGFHQQVAYAALFQPVGGEDAVSPVGIYLEGQCPVAGLADVVEFPVQEGVDFRSCLVQCHLNRRCACLDRECHAPVSNPCFFLCYSVFQSILHLVLLLPEDCLPIPSACRMKPVPTVLFRRSRRCRR